MRVYYNIPRLLTGVYGLRTGVMFPFGHDAVKTDAIEDLALTY
jgi:hypothetical protein